MVAIKDGAPDHATISGLETKKMEVTEFRNTVKANLTTTFGQNFDFVDFPGKGPEKGLCVVEIGNIFELGEDGDFHH